MPVSPIPSTAEVTLDRIAGDLVGVVQALRLMSDMQRQQAERLDLVIALLTPQTPEPRADLGELLRQLIGAISRLGIEVRGMNAGLAQLARGLPAQMAAAIDGALARAEQGSRR